MSFEIIRNDITKMQVDAIVTTANSDFSVGGGVNGSIHKAAGKELLAECKKLVPCKTGEARITSGYKLPAKYVIHTLGPVWQGGENGEEKSLRNCYRESLILAKKAGCESVAFPLISAGAFGYPKDKALRIAVDEISTFLFENEMKVYIVVFSKDALLISEKLFSDIKRYIDDNYTEKFDETESRRLFLRSLSAPCEPKSVAAEACFELAMPCKTLGEDSLEDLVKNLDESFSQMLLRKIDEKGMKDSECYKRANVDRKLFSKIRNNVNYKPSKTTAVAFAIALCLSFEETEALLKKAGYALSHSNKFDVIIEYFISRGNYNIMEINEALFAFDQSLLGV